MAALRRLAQERGIRAWIVGGAPRDALFGRSELDVDVAVSGDPEILARQMEAMGCGTAVAISERVPRVFRVAGRRPIDLAQLEGGSIGQDLARRDFTANAIAIELETGAWIDPFGGIEDLAARRLRLVRESNIAEDPLRALRAARLFATHGLRPDRRTRTACRAAAAGLKTAAEERIQTELTKMLESGRVAPAFVWAQKADLLPAVFGLDPPAARWNAAARCLGRLDGRPTAGLSGPRRRTLRLAAIAAGLDLPPGRASAWLRGRRFSRAEAGAVAGLLELAAVAPEARTDGAGWAWLHDAGGQAADALVLFEAIHPGRRPLARRLAALAMRARRGPAVTGKDVILWLGEAPGPEVGRLLREVRIEALSGRIRTRLQARRWLERLRDLNHIDRQPEIPKIVRRNKRLA